MEIKKAEWDDLWLSTNHLLADLIDLQNWTIYAIYKSVAGKGQIPKPKPIKRPQYGDEPRPDPKPRSLRELKGFMGEKILNAGKE